MSKTKELLYEKQNSIDDSEQGYKYIDVNKKHLHQLDGKPLLGTSTVVGIISKGSALSWWAAGLAVEKFGWTYKGNAKKGFVSKEERIIKAKNFLANEMLKYLSSPEAWLELCDEAYKAHSVKLDDSATAGTDMHAELEKYVKDCIKNFDGKPVPITLTQNNPLQIFSNWAVVNVKKFIWSEANVYSRELWLGGISDVGAIMSDDTLAIIDFKSSKEAYTSQFIQCALYALQAEENGLLDSNGNLVMKLPQKVSRVVIFPFGMDKPEAFERYNIDELKEAGKACVTLYKVNNN